MTALIKTLIDRRSDLLTALIQHLELSMIALLIAVAIAVPLAILVIPHRKVAEVLMQVTSILQTIPSLALLGLLIPFVGIGNTPAIIALIAYALLPIFTNTYTGISQIDPLYHEAATAFGMTRWQQLRKVELPMAMPTILSGIRTATVMIIGTATLAALVGAGGLGTFILLGINRNDSDLTLIGAIAAAGLAVILSLVLAGLQKLKWKQILIGLSILIVAGGGGWGIKQLTAPTVVNITIAGKLGSEPDILINMYKLMIEAKTTRVHVTLKPNFGQTTFLYRALKAKKIDVYPEFTGTVLESFVKPTAKQSAAIAQGADSYPVAKQLIKRQDHLTLLKPLAYNNTYAVVVTKKFAEENHVQTISDLRRVQSNLKAGFDLEFIDRRDGNVGLKQVYGLNLAISSLDPSLRYLALNKGDINVTDGYSTDSQLAQYHLIALKDDRHLFPEYRGAPLMRTDFAQSHPQIVKILNELAGKITETQMQAMNYAVNVQKKSAASVAKQFLIQHHLLTNGSK